MLLLIFLLRLMLMLLLRLIDIDIDRDRDIDIDSHVGWGNKSCNINSDIYHLSSLQLFLPP